MPEGPSGPLSGRQGPSGPLSGRQGPSGPLSGRQGPSGPLSGRQGPGRSGPLRRLALAVGLVVVALASTAPRSAAGTTSPRSPALGRPSRHDAFVEVTDGPENDQHVRLDTTLLVPAGVSATRLAPAVIGLHGLGGTKADEMPQAEQLAAHGFVVLVFSARGSGASSGSYELDAPDYEVKDVMQLVTWLANQPEVSKDGPGDPRVGLFGEASGAAVSLLAAAADRRIDAIVPMTTWSSLVHALSPNGDGALTRAPFRPGVLRPQAARALLAGDGASGARLGRDAVSVLAALLAAGAVPAASAAALDRSSPAGVLDRVQAPTLVVQGESDGLFTLDEADANFSGIRGTEKAMVWESGGYGIPPRPAEFDRAALDPHDVISRRVLAWFDRNLKRDLSIAIGPEFSWYDRDAARYLTSPSYPILGRRVFSLSADGRLATSSSSVVAGSLRFTSAPAGSSTSATAAATEVAFTSAPLQKELRVVGIPELRAHLASATGQATVFVKLYDVAPDGTASLLGPRAAPARYEHLPAAVAIELLGVVHRFERGHRVRVALASTDAAYPNRTADDTYRLIVDPADKVAPNVVELPALSDRGSLGGPLAVGIGIGGALTLLGASLAVTRRGRGRPRGVQTG